MPAPALSQPSLGGVIEWNSALGLGNDETTSSEVALRPEVEMDLGNTARFKVSARIRLDAFDKVEPGQPNLEGYDPLSRPATLGDAGTVELRDAVLELELGPAFVTAGKQQIVWGELEGFKVLDVVNPQSFRTFILDEFSESRIGLWALNAEVPLGDGNWAAQFVVVPDQTVHEIPEAGASFEFLASRFRFGAQASDPLPQQLRTERRENTLENAGMGARLTGLWSGWDLSVLAYAGTDPEPLGRVEITATGPELIRFHERRRVYGASAARSFGPVTTRFEAATQPNRHFVTNDGAGTLAHVEADQYSVAAVFDFNAPGDVFVSAQIVHDVVIDLSTDAIRPDADTLTSLYLRKSFQADRYTATFRWLGSDGASDGVISPNLSYDLNDNTRLQIGADLFYGERNGIFGQFDDNDRVTFAIKRFF